MTLQETAGAVLAANWRGASTVPSGRQYPHQWGWDAAYIAIGWSWVDPARAAAELESLLRGQWPDGRVPHIVFHPDVPEDAYFPGPAFWESDVDGVATSGLTQPPLHARAALEVARRSEDGTAFLRRVFGRLADQHAYLAGRRDVGGGGLAAIVHPWESGLDNSPAWDEPLAAVELPAEGVEPYERQDRRHVDASERPDDAAYDRFVHLARAYRDTGYADDGRSAFLVEDPLFNAIWLWSTHALIEIAELIGEDPGPHRESAARIHDGLHARLWDGSRFLPRDLRTDRLIERRTVLSLAPLLDPDLAPEVARAVADELALTALPGRRRSRRVLLRHARARVRAAPLLARPDLGEPELAAGPRAAPAGLRRAGRGAGSGHARPHRSLRDARVLRPDHRRRPRRGRLLVDGGGGARHHGLAVASVNVSVLA